MTILEVYFVYLNGTALTSEDVGRILNSQAVYEEYGVILQQLGLTGIVRNRNMAFFPSYVHVDYKLQQCLELYLFRNQTVVYLLLLMTFAEGNHRDDKRKQHSVVHHGGTRGRARDRPDRHHNVNDLHQEKVRNHTFMGKLPSSVQWLLSCAQRFGPLSKAFEPQMLRFPKRNG